jgi:hypothetical protein
MLAPTWLHWGDHAKPEPDGLTAQKVLARKSELLTPYSGLFQVLNHVLASAVERGVLAR